MARGEEGAAHADQRHGVRNKVAAVLSGSASGAVVSLCLQPLDVVRTQLQAQAVCSSSGTSRSAIRTAQSIWAGGGIRSFWRGSGPTVWRLSVGLGVQFFTLETIKDALLNGGSEHSANDRPEGTRPRQLTSLEAFCTGGLARGIAAAVTVPFTLAKTRMEYSGEGRHVYRGTFTALSSIVRSDGISGLFRGAAPTILTNAPFSAVYYMVYSKLKARIEKEKGTSPVVNFVSGTLAAVAATLLTQPTDMVRTQMQLGLAKGLPPASALATFRAVLRKGGPRMLLAGAAPRVLKRTMQTALVWTLYEELQPRLTAAVEKLQRTSK